MRKFALVAAMAISSVAVSAHAAFSISALTSFGGGDGWLAPAESINSTASTLGTASLERGMAYNPVTKNLVVVSRNGGNFVRIVNGTTGATVSTLPNGSGILATGTFTISTTAVDASGSIYVANLSSNTNTATTGVYKIYKWSSEAASAPTTYFNSNITATGTARLGDSLDLIDTANGPKFVAGFSGTNGYAIIEGSTPTASVVQTFAPAGPGSGDFRLGVTFAGSDTQVWGKQTGGTAGAAPLRRTTTAGVSQGSSIFTTGAEASMDFLTLGGLNLLATIDNNSSIVRIYDMTIPASPVLLLSKTNTTGVLTANGNGVGSVKWGEVNGNEATLYAMSTNQGIQAFTVSVPEPTALGLLTLAAPAMMRRRRA